MKLARYEAHGEVAYGVVEGDMVRQLTASPFEEYEITDHAHSLSEVTLLAPCTPGEILAMAINYRSHADEDTKLPEVPEPFFKVPSSLIGPGDAIVLPAEQIEHGSDEFLLSDGLVGFGVRSEGFQSR